MIELRGTLKSASALWITAILVGAVPQGAAAQDVSADEWLPWLGCWQATEAPADAPLTCVRPVAGGVELLAVTDAGVVESRAIRADGVPTSTTVGDCPATESAEFSSDGSRIYLETERACPGEPVRFSRGLIAMLDQDRWIEAQAVEVRGRTVAWVQRYEPAPRARAQALGQGELLALVDRRSGVIAAARAVASEPITVDQIIEAHARTDAEAVRVWVAEQLQPLYLDADGLIRLADAGVSEEVIDVVVAVAYPERFAVARDDPYYPRARGPRGPMFPPMYPGWGPYSGYWGRGYWGGYYRPTVIVVSPRDGTRGIARAVKGRGYTRGTPAATSGSGGSASKPQRPAASKPSSSSGSDRSTPPRRTAQPRGN
jgi:hypothetical protein